MLYHFSEDATIKVFTPRPTPSFPYLSPAVWAIDQNHANLYYFPRDCPRVIYWKTDFTSEQDIKKFFPDPNVEKVFVIENQWLERICHTQLFRYTFPPSTFQLFDQAKAAGYYVSFEEVIPLKVEPMGKLLEKLLSEKVELRFTPDLHPIRDSVISSSLEFSIIRFRNVVQPIELK